MSEEKPFYYKVRFPNADAIMKPVQVHVKATLVPESPHTQKTSVAKLLPGPRSAAITVVRSTHAVTVHAAEPVAYDDGGMARYKANANAAYKNDPFFVRGACVKTVA
ncbi:MAG: hypothetical protein RLZZ324_152 [Candidatus Parcubacteria bacterium]|jgi:hypothetical protein